MTTYTDTDIMMIGHLAKDRNVVDSHAETESGGGVYFGSVALRRLGVSVSIVTRLHPDDFPRLEELKQEGVQVFATPAPETSGIENRYSSADMERRICKPLGFAGRKGRSLLRRRIPPVLVSGANVEGVFDSDVR